MPQHLQDEATGETDRSNFSISTVLKKSRLYFRKKVKPCSHDTEKPCSYQVEVPQHFTFVETSYFNTGMCKFLSSQSDESRTQLADS